MTSDLDRSSEPANAGMLVDMFFSVSADDSADHEDYVLAKCIDKAYLDLGRALRYAKPDDDAGGNASNGLTLEQAKVLARFSSGLRADGCEDAHAMGGDCVAVQVKMLLGLAESAPVSQDDFDRSHEAACDALCELMNDASKGFGSNLYKDGFDFTCGCAQKWINMTLKYMLMSGAWDDKGILELKSVLHIPIDNLVLRYVYRESDGDDWLMRDGDSYLIREVDDDGHSVRDAEGDVDRSTRDALHDDEDGSPASDEHRLDEPGQRRPWSRIERYATYEFAQRKLREIAKASSEYATPIEWENAIWVSESRRREQADLLNRFKKSGLTRRRHF